MTKLVYLAGPVTGCSYGECTDWRQFVRVNLADHDIIGLSPMRSKQYLLEETTIEDSYTERVMSSQRGIFARDFWDATRCDILFVNLLSEYLGSNDNGSQKISIGTIMEIAWAHQARKPIVLVMDREDNVHEHSMIREACPFRVETVEEGISVVKKLLLEGDH